MTEDVRRALVALIFFGVASGPSRAQDEPWRPPGEPLAVEATGLVVVDTETSVLVRGIRGRISIAMIDARELHVVSRKAEAPSADAPLGIWESGSKLIVAPPPGDAGGDRAVRVEVPKNFSITVDANDSDVGFELAGGSAELRGRNVRALVEGGAGSLTADLVGGTLSITGGIDVSLRLKGTAAQIVDLHASATVHAAGGRLETSKLEGALDVESDGTDLVIDGSRGRIGVRARAGSATLSGFKAGAELTLSGTPLHLKEGKGDITVTSDATVDFQAMAASMHFDLYGGAVGGKGNQGILEVRTRNTEVNVSGIQDGMRLQGDGVTAHIEDVGQEIYVETSISDVVLDRVGTVILRVDRGSVKIQRAGGAVTANVVGANVQILDGNGPVTLDLDGGDAIVSWASLTGDKDSQLTNKSGSITAMFPASGGGRIEAKSKFGRIDSDLPTIKVMDDQDEAQGTLRGTYKPVVRIAAHGDVHLQLAGAAPVEEQ